MSKPIVFFSDLDRTLIYSKQFLKDSISSICIEHKGDKEISYMTVKAFEEFKRLKEIVQFIPVSTRTYETMTRIGFIQEEVPEWMICDNGAHIYHNGNLVAEWESIMNAKSKGLKFSVKNLEEKIEKIFSEHGLKEVFNREDLYLMLKFEEMTGEVRGMLEVLNLEIREYGFRMDINSRKAYILPDFVRKEDAVAYVIQLNHYQNTISAGDSLMDYGMLKVTNDSIAPKHKTFEDSTILLTENKGILAGEDIINYVKTHNFSVINAS